jgi:hypothetical protein
MLNTKAMEYLVLIDELNCDTKKKKIKSQTKTPKRRRACHWFKEPLSAQKATICFGQKGRIVDMEYSFLT